MNPYLLVHRQPHDYTGTPAAAAVMAAPLPRSRSRWTSWKVTARSRSRTHAETEACPRGPVKSAD